MSVFFISENYLNETSFLSPNIDFKIVEPVILSVQEEYIHDVLGTDLYNAMISHVNAWPGTSIPEPYNTLLVEYIKPCMRWFIQADISLPLKFRMEPKGIIENTGDNSSAIGLDALQMQMDWFKNKGEKWAEKTRKYLVQNYSSFPELSTNSDYNSNSPASSGYDTDFGFTACNE